MSSDRRLTRRHFLGVVGTVAATVPLAQGAHGAASAAENRAAENRATEASGPEESAAESRAAVRRALSFLDAATDAGGSGLPLSYADALGLGRVALTGDTADAVCALLAGSALVPAALDRARQLGDGLLAVLEPVGDGALVRQAYDLTTAPGVPAKALGLADARLVDVSRAGTALAQLGLRTGRRAYLDGAARLARWTAATLAGPHGFAWGVRADGGRVDWFSTEHNAQAAVLFGLLATTDLPATDQARWSQHLAQAQRLVSAMRRPGDRLAVGSRDGTTPAEGELPLGAAATVLLARGPSFAGPVRRALPVHQGPRTGGRGERLPATEPLAASAVFEGPDLARVASFPGIPVYRPGVWTEGTCRLAAALRRHGSAADARSANAMLDTVRAAQRDAGAGQTMAGRPLPERAGVVAAWSALDDGAEVEPFEVQSVGATAWFVLAQLGADPTTADGLTVTA